MAAVMVLGAQPNDGLADSFLSEELLRYLDLVIRLIEATGALVIFIGAVIAAVRFVSAEIRGRRAEDFRRVRLGLARYLILGLEFQLASDLLATAISPTFREIGQLAAIAAIRTALNYVLDREIEKNRSELKSSEQKLSERDRDDSQPGSIA